MTVARSTFPALAVALAAATPAAAQSSDGQVSALEQRIEAQDARIKALEAQLARLVEQKTASAAPDVQVTPPAPKPASEYPTARIRGRLQVDALLVNAPGERATGTQVRRAQIGVEGQITRELRYAINGEFAGSRVALEDTLVGYRLSERGELLAGYFKPPIALDEMTSDLWTLFLERSAYATAFAPGRRVGVGGIYGGDGWGLRGGLFGERDDALLDGDRAEGWLAASRIHADLLPGKAALHAALSAYRSVVGSDGRVSLSQRPEVGRAPAVLATGSFAAERGLFLGGELAYGAGPLTVQAEGGTLRYSGGPFEPRFWGYSGQVGWRITGEPRAYDPRAGIFGRVTPTGRLGAFELGLRTTYVDLTDNGILGGRLRTVGGVINWYPVQRVRIAGNIIHAVTERASRDDEQTLVTVRGGVDW